MMRFLAILCGLLFVAGQQVQYPPTTGSANFGAELKYDSLARTYSSFIRIPQTSKKEWEHLGTSFSVEFWVYWEAPTTCTTDGSWDPVCSPANNETQFIPLISRHPGLMLRNEWGHFLVQLTRTQSGAAVVAWAGCGCDAAPETINGQQPNANSCGFGYKLFTDHPQTAGGPFHLKPREWHHIAVTFDGDGTDLDGQKSRLSHLYIDGNMRNLNPWNAGDNNPGNPGICTGRPMQYFSNLGWMNSIAVGWYDNQDSPSFPDTPNYEVYGFNGRIDEIRIHKGPRTDFQVRYWYDLTWRQTMLMADPLLIGYYDFNDAPDTSSSCLFNNSARGQGFPRGHVVSSGPGAPSCDWTWNTTWGLVINDREKIMAKRQETNAPPQNVFLLRGSSETPNSGLPANTPPIRGAPWEAFIYTISSISPSLLDRINSNQVVLTRTRGGVRISAATIGNNGVVISNNDTLTMTANCNDRDCTNLADGSPQNPRDYFIEYQAWDSSLSPTAPAGVPTSPPARLFFAFEPECQGFYDACGVCDGNNSTCQCVVYHNFRNVRMAYVLLVHMTDYLMEKIENTVSIMEETLKLVQAPNFNYSPIDAQVVQQVEDLMKFYNGCLSDYCHQVFTFNTHLKTFQKKRKRDSLPVFPEAKVEKLLAFSSSL